MSWTLSTEAKAIDKAGNHADATIVADSTALAAWSDQAEGWVCSETRRDWVGKYSDVDTQVKNVLDDVVSSKVALNIIAWDTTGYRSREADTLMNLNDGIVTNGIKFLKDFKSNTIQDP